MTGEEIRAAIERLRECENITPTVFEVAGVFMDDSI